MFGGLDKFELGGGVVKDNSRLILKSSGFKNLNFSIHHGVSADFTLAAIANHTFTKKDVKTPPPTLSFGGIWKNSADSKVQTLIDEQAKITVSYIANLNKNLVLTLSAEADGKNRTVTNTGFGFDFSF
jgi:hypothetical protein